MPLRITTLLLVITLLSSCKKEEVVFQNNEIPPYSEIPTIRVQNYVNRLFIDLLGREPLDAEMDVEVAALETADLSFQARENLIEKLMFDQTFLENDSSYNHAYFQKVYEDTKARLIDGASDALIWQRYDMYYNQAIADSLEGNFTDYERNIREAERLEDIINSRSEYRLGEIGIREMYRRMIDNAVYDEINMNSFNYINATFNDLFLRFPTDAEFEQAYQIIEFNEPAVIFGLVAQNEVEYLDILLNSNEYSEGMVRWAFQTLLAREPVTYESFTLGNDFSAEYNLQELQKELLKSDEYAGFDE
ncbi:MAG: hypothetical protein KDK38_14875 [Leptospiraceae bacterium]|nr:hypothetical protein [Leptospiraceae bacterium]